MSAPSELRLLLEELKLLQQEYESWLKNIEQAGGGDRVVDATARPCPMCGVRSRERQAWPPESHMKAEVDE